MKQASFATLDLFKAVCDYVKPFPHSNQYVIITEIRFDFKKMIATKMRSTGNLSNSVLRNGRNRALNPNLVMFGAYDLDNYESLWIKRILILIYWRRSLCFYSPNANALIPNCRSCSSLPQPWSFSAVRFHFTRTFSRTYLQDTTSDWHPIRSCDKAAVELLGEITFLDG